MASSTANPTTFALNEGQNAPINSGSRAQQANAAGAIVAGGGVKVESTDSRNFGQSFGNVGSGATVNVVNADPFVALNATNAIRDTSLAGLAANLAANQGALDFAKGAQEQAGLANLAAISATNDTARAALAANLSAQAEGATVARNASDNQALATLAALNGNQVATLAALQSTVAGQEQAFGFANAANARADETARAALAANVAGQDRAFTFADSAGARTLDAARAALAANLTAQQNALTTVQAVNDGAFGLQATTLANIAELDRRRSIETTNTINSATDQAREAAARSESIVQSALNKLSDQRAPDGANTVKIVLYIALAFAAIFGLRALRSAKS